MLSHGFEKVEKPRFVSWPAQNRHECKENNGQAGGARDGIGDVVIDQSSAEGCIKKREREREKKDILEMSHSIDPCIGIGACHSQGRIIKPCDAMRDS